MLQDASYGFDAKEFIIYFLVGLNHNGRIGEEVARAIINSMPFSVLSFS